MLTVVKIDGEKVRAARERAFLSKGELAEQADLDRNTIGRIEKPSPQIPRPSFRRSSHAQH
jgi:predicted transcriptional regulator